MEETQSNDGFLAILSMIVLSVSWLQLDSIEHLPLKITISLLMILTTAILFHRDSVLAVPALFLVGLCLRFHYLSFVGFEHVPYGDAQIDLFMTNVLSENGQITFIHHELYDDRLLYYSSWPLSQITVVMFSFLASTENMFSTHMMQFAYYSSCFLLAYSISSWFNNKILDGSEQNLRWAILLFVILPELNYWQGEFVRLNHGLLSSFFVIYSMTLMASSDSRLQSSVLLLLSCTMLGFSHNLTTAISVLAFFIALLIMVGITARDGSIRDRETKTFLNTLFNNLALLSVMGIIWWSLVGEVLFPKIQGVVGRYSRLLTDGFSLTHDPRLQIAPELSPIWSEVFLYGRDFIVLGSTAIGFLLLCRKYLGGRSMPFNILFSFSVSYFIIFILLFLWAEPFRVLTYASPFMAICMACFFSSGSIWNRFPNPTQVKSMLFLIVIIGAFISPHAHTHSPMFFYDKELREVDYGLPGTNARTAIFFTLEHSHEDSEIASDYPDFAIHPIGPSDVSRFFSIALDLEENSDEVNYNSQTRIVLLIRDGSLYQHQSAQSTNSSFVEFTAEAKTAISEELWGNGNRVYDQGDGVSIWTMPS